MIPIFLNINSPGTFPFECANWEGKPLFIIEGGIRGSLFPTLYGKAYLYEEFPWPEGKKITKEECRVIAQQNRDSAPQLWVTETVSQQFHRILSQHRNEIN